MTRRAFAYCVAALLSVAGLYGGCDNTVTATDCTVKCHDTDNTCVQKCTDDACKTVCTTDLDNCVASCSSVTTSAPNNGG